MRDDMSKEIELLIEINDYLNISKLESIGSGSIFHQQIKELLNANRFCEKHNESRDKGYCNGCSDDELKDNQV